MHPVICQIGPVTIYSYGLLLALAVIVCSWLMSRDPYRGDLKQGDIFDFVFWTVISGIAGARIFFVLINLEFYLVYPSEIIMIQHGGLSFQGSLAGGFLGAVVFMKGRKLPVLKTLDFIAPYIALGHGIGRIGCFLNGCCYGHKAPWGLYFPVHMAKLVPVQLYSFAALVLLFILLKRMQPLFKIPGQIFSLYLVLYALLRFVIEFFRADHTLVWAHMSIYQVLCLFIFTAGVLMYGLVSNRK